MYALNKVEESLVIGSPEKRFDKVVEAIGPIFPSLRKVNFYQSRSVCVSGGGEKIANTCKVGRGPFSAVVRGPHKCYYNIALSTD